MIINAHPRKHQKRWGGLGALLVAVIFFAMALPAGAVDKGPVSIKPIPGTTYEPGHDFRKDVEGHYHLTGTVDDVHADGIVVNDSYFKKAPRAIISGAGKGSRVGLVLNEAGELVLCEPYRGTGR